MTKFKHPTFFTFLGLLGFLFLRAHARLSDPNLWSEDGAIFLEQYFRQGWASLFTPYTGYFHVFPRLIMILSSYFGVHLLPLVSNFLSTVLMAFCLARLASRDFSWLFPSTPLRLVAVFALSFVGGLREVVGNPTNLHWFFNFYLMLLALRSLEAKLCWPERILAFLMISSTGECSTLLPLFMLRIFYQYKSARTLSSAVKESVGATLSVLIFTVLNILVREVDPSKTVPKFARVMELFKSILANHLTLQPLVGDVATQFIGGHVPFVLLWGSALLLWVLVLLPWLRERKAPAIFILTGVLCYFLMGLLMASVREWPYFFFSQPVRLLEHFQDRYAVVFTGIGFLFWLYVFSQHRIFRRQEAWAWTYAIIFIFLGASQRFWVPPHANTEKTWAENLKALEFKGCAQDYTLPIRPAPMSFQLPGSYVFAQCYKDK